MRTPRILTAAVFATCLVAAHQSGGQSPPAPCSADAAGQANFDAIDRDEFPGTTLVATHTIRVRVDGPPTDDISVSAPGITGTARPGELTFFSDTPGPLPVTATWTQDDGTGHGTCAATATTTLQLQPATPIGRLKSRDVGKVNLRYALNWIYGVDLGPTADLRPVVVSWRGVRSQRLPGPSVPFKTLTAPLRSADPGYHDLPRKLPLPRMLFQLSAGRDIVAVHLDSVTSTRHARPVAYDIELQQAGRLLARFRLAGACSAFNCQMRTVKVQR